jgi:hypothetical protein
VLGVRYQPSDPKAEVAAIHQHLRDQGKHRIPVEVSVLLNVRVLGLEDLELVGPASLIDVDACGPQTVYVACAILGHEVDNPFARAKRVAHERQQRPILVVVRRKKGAYVPEVAED